MNPRRPILERKCRRAERTIPGPRSSAIACRREADSKDIRDRLAALWRGGAHLSTGAGNLPGGGRHDDELTNGGSARIALLALPQPCALYRNAEQRLPCQSLR